MAFPPPPKSSPQSSRWQRLLAQAGKVGQPSVLATLAASALVLGVRAVGALQGLELGLYDQMMRLRPTPLPDDRILVVGIDETDIQSRQEWPIQDDTIAELLSVLIEAEPRAVGLDMFRDLPIGEGRDTLLEQIQNNSTIFPVCKISSPDNPGVPPPPGTPEAQVSFSDLVVDPGGILRRSLLIAAPPTDADTVGTHICNDPNAQLFSLGLQLARQYLTTEGIELEVTAEQELRFGNVVLSRLQSNLGGYHNIDAQGYQIMLNYRAARMAVPQVSLTDVLSGDVGAAQIRDRIVLIGATTPEAKDEFYTPFSGGLRDSQKMAGVIVHAQSVSQILSAVLDDRPLLWSLPTWGEALWVVIWGLGGALFATYIRRPVTYGAVAIALLGGLYGLCFVVFLQGGWLPIVPAALALGFASGGVVLLDRFNKSDYGQAVYKQMKVLLRLDIEIDHSKVGEQVAEITDTEYFNTLQAQARELRARRQGKQSTTPTDTRTSTTPAATSASDEPSEPITTDDYLQNLKQKAERFKSTSDLKSKSDKPDAES
ncbi:CHASE2 domain-containing protein [Leptolyngbya iicbica]|uniref:CHASE2 domain-containing protein n=2 Tax=Cyanophyceae TaxID=3028117 RepID=A0A4Q7EG81_9CYAN|nr:CHASE2 domain-containing protein [Leptolyngbya sp. LK]RZM82272.1 CHASE2 domain-containing protein [Leptolyngbya sp. LK]